MTYLDLHVLLLLSQRQDSISIYKAIAIYLGSDAQEIFCDMIADSSLHNRKQGLRLQIMERCRKELDRPCGDEAYIDGLTLGMAIHELKKAAVAESFIKELNAAQLRMIDSRDPLQEVLRLQQRLQQLTSVMSSDAKGDITDNHEDMIR